MDAVELLARQPLFQGLGADALGAVAGRTVRKRLSRGAILFREGDACRGLFIVVRGRVVAYRAGAEGREQVLDAAGPGESIAELPLLDTGPYPASARAAEPSEVLFLSVNDFEWLYRSNPEIADSVVRCLGGRLRRLVRLVGKLALSDVSARVAFALLEYGAAHGPVRDGSTFRLPRRHHELAAELSTTRESVTRAFAKLRRDGLIAQRGRDIVILSAHRLRGLAGTGESPLRIPA